MVSSVPRAGKHKRVPSFPDPPDALLRLPQPLQGRGASRGRGALRAHPGSRGACVRGQRTPGHLPWGAAGFRQGATAVLEQRELSPAFRVHAAAAARSSVARSSFLCTVRVLARTARRRTLLSGARTPSGHPQVAGLGLEPGRTGCGHTYRASCGTGSAGSGSAPRRHQSPRLPDAARALVCRKGPNCDTEGRVLALDRVKKKNFWKRNQKSPSLYKALFRFPQGSPVRFSKFV